MFIINIGGRSLRKWGFSLNKFISEADLKYLCTEILKTRWNYDTDGYR